MKLSIALLLSMALGCVAQSNINSSSIIKINFEGRDLLFDSHLLILPNPEALPEFWNDDQTVTCPAGSEGAPVTIPYHTFSSPISVNHANETAINYGQSLLICTNLAPAVFFNVEQKACCPNNTDSKAAYPPNGCITVLAKRYSSFLSQAAADNAALAAARRALICLPTDVGVTACGYPIDPWGGDPYGMYPNSTNWHYAAIVGKIHEPGANPIYDGPELFGGRQPSRAFRPIANYTLCSASFRLMRRIIGEGSRAKMNGIGNGLMHAKIFTDSVITNGDIITHGAGTLIGTSEPVSVTSIPLETFTWINFHFAFIGFDPATTYWISVSADDIQQAGPYIYWSTSSSRSPNPGDSGFPYGSLGQVPTGFINNNPDNWYFGLLTGTIPRIDVPLDFILYTYIPNNPPHP